MVDVHLFFFLLLWWFMEGAIQSFCPMNPKQQHSTRPPESALSARLSSRQIRPKFENTLNIAGTFLKMAVFLAGTRPRSGGLSVSVYKLEFKISQEFARSYILKGLFNQLYGGLCQMWIKSSVTADPQNLRYPLDYLAGTSCKKSEIH